MEHNYEYKLDNVVLRPLQHEDIEYLRIWRNNPENNKYLNQIPYITVEMQEEWFKRYLENKDEIAFAIIEESIINRIVGSLSLYNIEEGSIEIGKIMVGDPGAHGKKVGENATKAATVIAHEMLGKSMIIMHVYEMNIAAVKAYKNAGFKIAEKHVDEQGRAELTMTKKY